MPRTKIDHYLEDNVAAGSGETYSLPNIAVDAEHVITAFGGALQEKGRIFLERRNAVDPANWLTIRAITSPGGTFEFRDIKAVAGDGIARLRIRRINDHTAAVQIYAWIEGFVR